MRKPGKVWSAEEDALVISLYPVCLSCEEMIRALPNRTWPNVVARARKLGAMRRAPVGRSRGMANPLAVGRGHIPGSYVSRLRCGARGRGLACSLLDGSEDSYAYLNGLVTERCPFSGRALTFPAYSGDASGTASLDRIDSDQGYIKGNVRWVHKVVNKMRRDMDDEMFMALIRDIAKHTRTLS